MCVISSCTRENMGIENKTPFFLCHDWDTVIWVLHSIFSAFALPDHDHHGCNVCADILTFCLIRTARWSWYISVSFFNFFFLSVNSCEICTIDFVSTRLYSSFIRLSVDNFLEKQITRFQQIGSKFDQKLLLMLIN